MATYWRGLQQLVNLLTTCSVLEGEMEAMLKKYLIGIQREVNYVEKVRENCHSAT